MNVLYAVYWKNAYGGTLVKSGYCPSGMAHLQAGENQLVFIFEGTDQNPAHFAVNAENKLVFIGEMPPFSRFDADTLSYVLDVDLLAQSVLKKRNDLLAKSDWTQLPDVPEETQARWKDYRQALRDITDQADFPHQIDWPIAPN